MAHFKISGLFVVVGLALSSCGSDDSDSDNISIDDLGWADGKSTLSSAGEVLKIEGDVEATTTPTLSFDIVDDRGKVISQEDDTLKAYRSPAGDADDQLTFTLTDRDARLQAGASACDGSYQLKLTAKAGTASKSQSLKFTVSGINDCSVKLEGEGAVRNILGPEPGAFDLVQGNEVGRSSDDAIKDLKDLTVLGSTQENGGFKTTLGSGNGALFIVNPNGISFDHPIKSNIEAAFNNTAGITETPELKADDLVIVKLSDDREGSYSVLLITKVDKTTDPSVAGTNGGIIAFKFRTLPQ